MARKKKEPRGSKAKPAKVSRRSAPAADAVVEVEEVKSGGMGVDEGVIIGTTLLLAVACFVMWQAMQVYSA